MLGIPQVRGRRVSEELAHALLSTLLSSSSPALPTGSVDDEDGLSDKRRDAGVVLGCSQSPEAELPPLDYADDETHSTYSTADGVIKHPDASTKCEPAILKSSMHTPKRSNGDSMDVSKISLPAGTQHWEGALTQLASGNLDLNSVLDNVGFTVARVPFRVRPLYVRNVHYLLLVLQQTQVNSILYDRLMNLLFVFPQIVLRVGPKDDQQQQADTIRRALLSFENGKWDALFKDIVRAGAKRRSARAKSTPNKDLVLSVDERVQAAEACVRQGASLRKARALLTSAGFAQGDVSEILADLRKRNPTASIEDAVEESAASSIPRCDISLSREHYLKVARKAKPLKACDQWGWREREHLLPLLYDGKCGDLFVDIVLNPLARGVLQCGDALHARMAGGKLFALSKAPKKGVRPIVVGDAIRSLVAKTLFADKSLAAEMRKYFTSKHPRVMQLAVGSPNGASTLFHVITCLVNGMSADISDARRDDTHCKAVISLDIHNAFNEVSRKAVFNTILGNKEKYASSMFEKVVPFLHFFYGTNGKLKYTTPSGDIVDINSEVGTHQGDVWSPALFAATIHPCVCEAVDLHEDVVAVLWADNIFLVGPADSAVKVAGEIKKNLSQVRLCLNEEESVVYIPQWGGFKENETAWARLLPLMQDCALKYEPYGLKIVGIPFGTPAFVSTHLSNIVDKIIRDFEAVSCLKDGLLHFQMMRFCENQRFNYVTQALPPHVVRPHAKRLDDAVMQALERYWEWPEMVPLEDADLYRGARQCVREPIQRGGFGVTAITDILEPAFFHAAAHSVRFISTAGLVPFVPGIDSNSWFESGSFIMLINNGFIADLQAATESLLQFGCKLRTSGADLPRGDQAILPSWGMLVSPTE